MAILYSCQNYFFCEIDGFIHSFIQSFNHFQLLFSLIITTSTSMRLNKNKLHLTAFILASFASLPVHVSAVFEKGDKRAKIPGKLDDGQEILDYIVRFRDTRSYKSFVESNEVQAMTTVKSLSFMNTQVLKFPSEGDAKAWCAERKDVKLCVKGESTSQSRKETYLQCVWCLFHCR